MSLPGDSRLVQQIFVSGHCSDLAFQVEFQLSEVKVSHDNISDYLRVSGPDLSVANSPAGCSSF